MAVVTFVCAVLAARTVCEKGRYGTVPEAEGGGSHGRNWESAESAGLLGASNPCEADVFVGAICNTCYGKDLRAGRMCCGAGGAKKVRFGGFLRLKAPCGAAKILDFPVGP